MILCPTNLSELDKLKGLILSLQYLLFLPQHGYLGRETFMEVWKGSRRTRKKGSEINQTIDFNLKTGSERDIELSDISRDEFSELLKIKHFLFFFLFPLLFPVWKKKHFFILFHFISEKKDSRKEKPLKSILGEVGPLIGNQFPVAFVLPTFSNIFLPKEKNISSFLTLLLNDKQKTWEGVMEVFLGSFWYFSQTLSTSAEETTSGNPSASFPFFPTHLSFPKERRFKQPQKN